MINTKRVRDRRKLRFESFDEALRDAEALANAERDGRLRTTGNWTLGQALGHEAYWARLPFDGYPPLPKMPWLLRLVVPLFKKHFLNKRLPPGARIRGIPEGTLGTEPMNTYQALHELRSALTRLQSEMPPRNNPVLGTMTHDDWIKLNLRHAELHQSFFHPD